jgi:DNA-binding NarL/FixJ family response regulator
MMRRPRVMLADDHTLLVDAFRRLLEPEFEIVGTAADGPSTLERAPRLKPDVVVLDLGMPLLNGMDTGAELKRLLPNTKIVVLTITDDFDIAASALRQWASGYLLKKCASWELAQAIREVLKGNSYVTPSVAKKLDEEFVRDPRLDRRKQLTPRQREILQLLAEGCSMNRAGAILNISTRTVAFHKYRIMEEFGLKTNADLVTFAIREGVLRKPA